jgi:predicted transposase/invertase (TIGR01784 family)
MRYYQGMIDLNMIERGARYKELKKSFIIFICLKNPYPEAGLHKYSIRSVCEEDATIDYDDGIFKVILSARGDKGDVPDEMSKFLLYLTDQRAESAFTKRLNERVLAARSHEEWRREYMTLQERDERMREEGRKEGREEGRKEGTEIATLNSIKNLMETMAISAEKAMDLVKIPAEERERYLTKL